MNSLFLFSIIYTFPPLRAPYFPPSSLSPTQGRGFPHSRLPHSISPHHQVPAEGFTPPLKQPPPEFLTSWSNEVERQSLPFPISSLSLCLLNESRSFFFFPFSSWGRQLGEGGELRPLGSKDWAVGSPSHYPSLKTPSLLSDISGCFQCYKSFLDTVGVGKESCSE